MTINNIYENRIKFKNKVRLKQQTQDRNEKEK